MSAVGTFADSPQSLLLRGVRCHGVLVPTSVSSIWAASGLKTSAQALLSLALAISLTLAFALSSFTLALRPLVASLGLGALEAVRVR